MVDLKLWVQISIDNVESPEAVDAELIRHALLELLSFHTPSEVRVEEVGREVSASN
jgi:hypothetical protein